MRKMAATDQNQISMQRLDKLSQILDSSIKLPGGYRIGWDGIIGLIPGIGDIIGFAMSSYIVIGAYRMGASTSTLLRMLINVGIETIVGAVPIIGDIFDLAFKANNRNIRLLKRQMSTPQAVNVESKRGVLAILFVVVFLILLVLIAVSSLIIGLFRLVF